MLKKNEKGLTIKQQKTIALLVTKDLHNMTVHDIAQEVGVAPQTIYHWQRNDSRFIEELNKEADKVMDAFLVECYDVLQNIVRDPNEPTKNKLQAIDKVLKLKGKYVEKHSIEVENKSTRELQELARLEVIELQHELLESGTLSPEDVEEISVRWGGNIQNVKNELEVIKLEKELIDEGE